MTTENIKGKAIAITGASSGIGEATARYLASLGASVVLGARRKENLEAIVSEIRANGGSAEFIKTDATNRKDIQQLVDKAITSFGKIDVMINNAGIFSVAPMSETRVDEGDYMIDLNIKGVLYGIAAALPIFEKQGSGHFINLSSVAGIKVFSPGGTVYSGTKYAVRAITEGLRIEVGEKIRTTSIEPGTIRTEILNGISHKESHENMSEFFKIAIPELTIAKAIAYAIEQPTDVDINEIVIRPTVQEF